MRRTRLGSEEYREKMRQSSKDVWDNYTEEERNWRRRLASEVWTPERRMARSKMMKKRMEDPDASRIYRENLSKAVREANLRPEVIQKRKEAMQIIVSDPEYRKKLKERANTPWNKELNARVRGPLAIITRKLKSGKITEEEARVKREELNIIKREIHEKYAEQEEEYLRNHPTKYKRKRKESLKNE